MYKEQKRSWVKHFDFIVMDLILLQISFIIAYTMRHGMKWLYGDRNYMRLGIAIFFIDLCVAFFLENYSGILKRGYIIEFKKTVLHISVIMVILLTYLFFTKDTVVFSRAIIGMMWVLSIGFCYVGRVLLKRYLRRHLNNADNVRRVLVVATEKKAEESVTAVRHGFYAGIEPIGVIIVGTDSPQHKICEIPVVADENHIVEYIRTNVVDEVFVNCEYQAESLDGVMEKCIEMGVTVHVNLLQYENSVGEKQIGEFVGYTVATNTFKTVTARQLFMKRMLDVAGGLVGVFLTGIIFLFVAPIIYFQSPGPIFFSQMRVGRNGRKFKIYKFRSMYVDAEERKKELMAQNQMQGLMFKMDNDPRIFPFGHFLRDTSLDEFPQFWNVLKGDMSLVGTRPPTVDEYEQYEVHHKKRVSIKPGLTGLWQVSGRSNITDFEEVVRLDTKYIADWRLASDIKILFQTVGVVLQKKGSR